ncbi:FadR/GntR family transcriptional regulator [Thermovenabulum sp.]|uniref:FadR/GntR family transcriptional regulator n=1 Tax=Thermovenabulum sp. TaxID=3100335 RepID=UPI003C7D1B35
MIKNINKIKRPSKITETIADEIRSLIKKGVLKPGEKVPTEMELCEAFGVGRSSVREALQSLEHLGLIETRPGIGRFLNKDAIMILNSLTWGQMLERASMFELMEVRRILEVTAAKLAAQRATDDDVSELEEIIKEMKKIDNDNFDLFFDYDLQFHLTLSASCKNSLLTELINLLMQRVAGQAIAFMKTLPYTREITIKQFEKIINAIKDGDPISASEGMEEHLDIVKSVLNMENNPQSK